MVKFHTSKDSTWVNASGDPMPAKALTHLDVIKEKHAAKVYKLAIQAENALKTLNDFLTEATAEITELIRKQYEIKYNKKKKETESLTWYNYDNSIKIEAKSSDIVKFDDALMNEARTLINKYLDGRDKDEDAILIRKMLNDAYSNRKGGIVPAMINKIIKYRSEVKNQHFQKACDIMIQAQSTDKTKIANYIWERQDNGEYRNIKLNFNSI